MKSKYFASLNGKEITLLGDAVPEHDLLENQIPLTYEEFKLLKACSSIEKAKSLYSSVEAKIEAVEIGGITQWVGQEPTSNHDMLVRAGVVNSDGSLKPYIATGHKSEPLPAFEDLYGDDLVF